MKVSICITSFNQAKYLSEAVESTLNQTVRPDEIIISDDCSADDSWQVIKSYEKLYPDLVRGFRHERNLGIPANKTFAIEQARADWVVGLDGDDRLLPSKIETSLNTAASFPSARLVFGNFFFIDEQGVRQSLWINSTAEVPPSGDAFSEVFCKSFPGNILFRNELIHLPSLLDVGLYDPEMSIYEDWEFRIRFSHRYRLAYSPEPLSEYRLHKGGISTVHPAKHADFIRLLFTKNMHLLAGLSPAERKGVLDRFAVVESHFANSGTKELLGRGHLLKAYSAWKVQREFRSQLARM